MAFELDHVGVVVDVEVSETQWAAEATVFAVSTDGRRVMATPHHHMSSAGPSRGASAIWTRYAGPPLPEDAGESERVLAAYRVQRSDVEDAINQLLGRDPEQHRPPRLAWNFLIERLAEHGTVISEEQLIAMPFRFEFSEAAIAALRRP